MTLPTLYFQAGPPVPRKITGLRGRDKNADLISVARLWLSDAYVRAQYGAVVFKVLELLNIERPNTLDRPRWRRLERYAEDLLGAVPAYLYNLLDESKK